LDERKTTLNGTVLTLNPYDYLGKLHNKGMSDLKNTSLKKNIDVGSFVTKFMVKEINKEKNDINQKK
jgi:hypothetical protein